MKTLSGEQLISTAAAAAPFFAAQLGAPKLQLGLGAALIIGEYVWSNSELDGTPAMPYTQSDWQTVGIYAAGLAAAYWKPQWALAIAASVLAIDVYRAGGFGSDTSGPANTTGPANTFDPNG